MPVAAIDAAARSCRNDARPPPRISRQLRAEEGENERQRKEEEEKDKRDRVWGRGREGEIGPMQLDEDTAAGSAARLRGVGPVVAKWSVKGEQKEEEGGEGACVVVSSLCVDRMWERMQVKRTTRVWLNNRVH